MRGARSARGLAAVASTLLLGSAAVRAQTPPTFAASTEAVRVDVLVTDGRGPVPGLMPEDFEVRDDGVAQKVEIASFETLPLRIVLALDTSGSVSGPRVAALQAASQAIVGQLRPGDRAALLTFSSALAVRAELTGDVERVRSALLELPVAGETALVDATQAALALAESDDSRALVILLSDGVDTASFLTPQAVLETARRADVVVYGVALARPERRSFLAQVCAATGGRVVEAGSSDGIRDAFLRVLAEFRHRYLLSYTPQGAPRRGWHELAVRVPKRRAHVEARPGYFGEH